ncbi:AMP-binding protein [Micromonospora sp. WMMD712]|uniref:class I adenylate-forming enzyme family protein n=1 Tax=Micromonospora sp. WMMD712 TaxID=3016096 RepID=UPI00249AAC74|nr:AMP-binding protein [Micromonospora sp. WMMD712]WFE60208.1 AMP-binding protein [Micromonospora sp. WMMD712]
MIEQMLRATAAAVPAGDAIVYQDRRITYDELYRSVRAGADGLRLHGVGPGDTVLLALTNCPEFVTVYFATALLHAKVYAIDPNAAEPELRRCIRDAEPVLVVTHAMRAGTFQRLLAERADLRSRIAVVGGERGGHLLVADLFTTTNAASSGPADPYPGEWSVTYSSGSTGAPKRICRTQRNQVAEADNITRTAGIGPQDRMLCVVPLFHALGQFCCMIVAARAGATLVLLEQTGPPGQEGDRQLVLGSRIDRVLEMIEKHGVTVMPAVPYIYELLADVDERHPADVSTVRLFLSGGNFLPTATAERFLRRYGKPIRQTYGSSEAGSVAWDCRDPRHATAGSVGHVLDGVEVRLVDGDRQPLPPGSVGEVAVRGPSVMTGYDGRPDLTEEVLADGFYHTGDLGTLDEDGRLYITGRLNLLIDTGGRKVNPLEVEAVLVEHERVREAVVTGVGTRGGDEILVAVVVADGPVDADTLLDFCRGRLTDYKVPHRLVFRDALPRSPLGKVLRRNLDLGTEETAASPRATDNRPAEMTAYLVGQLARLLRVPPERIDVTAPVLATGLNSLVAMQLRLAIERDLGVPAQLGTLLGARSLADAAARLTDPGRSPDAALMPAAGPPEFPLAAAQLPYVSAPAPWAAHLLAARLAGHVDEAALRAAFQALVDRHPMLRMAVDPSGPAPTQLTMPRVEVSFGVEDVPPAELPARMSALAATAAALPRSAGGGPLHVRLLRDGAQAPLLAVGVHRIAADRWSLAVLLRDLAMLLGGQRFSDDTYLPALPYTYRDFVQWSAGQAPAAAPFAPVESPEARITEVTLDPALAGVLRRLAGQRDVSVASLLLAAVTAAAGDDRVAAVHFGRDRPEFHDLVGRFARVVSVPGGDALESVLPTVRDWSALPAAGRNDRPAVLVVDDTGPLPALAHQMRFVAAGGETVALGSLRLRSVPFGVRPLSAPVECRMSRVGDDVTVSWRYDARDDADRIDELRARFDGILRTAAGQTANRR